MSVSVKILFFVEFLWVFIKQYFFWKSIYIPYTFHFLFFGNQKIKNEGSFKLFFRKCFLKLSRSIAVVELSKLMPL